MTVITEQEVPTELGSPPPAGSRVPLFIGIIAVVAVVVGILAFRYSNRNDTSTPSANQGPVTAGMPTSPKIEEKYGIKFTILAMTSANGLIDMRYTVLDTTKAEIVHGGEDKASVPHIIDKASGKTINPFGLMSHMRGTGLVKGRTYSMLYGNAGNTLKTGSIVTITVGDLKITDVVVQ